MFDISPIQIMIVLAIALLIFGPKRLPDLGRNLGRGIRDFKDGLTNDTPAHVQVQQSAQADASDAVEGPAFEPEVSPEEALGPRRQADTEVRMTAGHAASPAA